MARWNNLWYQVRDIQVDLSPHSLTVVRVFRFLVEPLVFRLLRVVSGVSEGLCDIDDP